MELHYISKNILNIRIRCYDNKKQERSDSVSHTFSYRDAELYSEVKAQAPPALPAAFRTIPPFSELIAPTLDTRRRRTHQKPDFLCHTSLWGMAFYLPIILE